MSLYCTSLLQDAADELGVDEGNERYKRRFVNAINRTLDEISLDSDLASAYAHISSTDDTISIDEVYGWIVYAGLIYHLIRMGQRPSDPKLALLIYQDSKERWNYAKGMYQTGELNELQSVATNNIINFGSMSDS